MKLFNRNRADLLQGKWGLDPSDARAVAEFGQVVIEFRNGHLTYEVGLADKRQIILMTYRIDGDVLVTDQPSHPNIERTKFLLQDNKLTLTFGGVSSRFVRL